MPTVELKRAGTNSATWLVGPNVGEAVEFTLDQTSFAALPDGSALKAVLMADYGSRAEMGAALARVGFSVSANAFPTEVGGGSIRCTYYPLDGKMVVWCFASPDSVDWASVKLAVAYSASR